MVLQKCFIIMWPRVDRSRLRLEIPSINQKLPSPTENISTIAGSIESFEVVTEVNKQYIGNNRLMTVLLFYVKSNLHIITDSHSTCFRYY